MRFILNLFLAGLLTACSAGGIKTETDIDVEIEQAQEAALVSETDHPFYDSTRIDWFRVTKNGDFSAAERRERIKTLPNGEKIFEDIGVTFIWVKQGDTLTKIRKNLGKYSTYRYVTLHSNRVLSFNIKASKVPAEAWIPIPMREEDRHMNDEQFYAYALQGISEMREHPIYGTGVNEILQVVSVRELLATMYAVAKQESGGHPIGNLVFHRWEEGHRAFSFSAYHVLMKDAGLRARRALDLSEGQCYHPVNGTKLFLAYMIEKSRNPPGLFPVDEHLIAFTVFYNGARWEDFNPKYPDHIETYYHEALAALPE